LDNTLILYLQDNGGCAEGLGRSEKMPRWAGKEVNPEDARPMKPDELQTEMVPLWTRDAKPMRIGPKSMPGPADTYIAYGKNWANVSNTPFREYKSHNHEGGISTPLIAHWPKGIKAKGELRHEPGHLIDLMATCIELSGATYPKKFAEHEILPMEGRSLAGGFAGDRAGERTLIFEHFGKAAIRKGNWKLVRSGGKSKWELYEIDKDRTELKDLSQEKPELAEELAHLWEQEAKRTLIYPKPMSRRR